ncbi:MAG: glycine cleavage system protein H [Desulfobacterales bacterium]|nr:glycine cleavage system protein H [Desulfobacterales bacterium]
MTTLAKERKAVTSPCIWMQAGVAKKKSCNNFYDCTTCKYDTAMAKAASTGKHMSWQDAMRQYDSKDRTCRHALTGRTGHRVCPMNYNCDHCDFDQTFEEAMSIGAVPVVGQYTDIKGFRLPLGHYFHMGHTWARIEDGGIIRIGMDDFSFKVLGNPDRMELPLMGQELNHGRAGWGMGRKDHFADVQSPINGVITSVNPAPMKDAGRISDDPYTDGWLFTVHNNDLKGAVKPLMDDEKSPVWLDSEVTGLEQMIEDVAGPLSTDGGTLTRDVYGNLPGLGWDNLVNRFLGT